MGKKEKDMIHVLGIALEQYAGATVRAKVMAGRASTRSALVGGAEPGYDSRVRIPWM